MQSITIEQGGLLRIWEDELPVIKDILAKRGMSWDGLDISQSIIKLPQQYVGYIGLPRRKIVIKPKHNGVTISHILRIYFFLYSAEYSDLDTPMYDIDSGNDVNLITMFLQEMLSVVHRGLPLDYKAKEEDLTYIKGNLRTISTAINLKMHKQDPFRCIYDDLTKDVPINRLLFAALRKIEDNYNGTDLSYIMKQFDGVNTVDYPDQIILNRNTSYCKKAVSLAYMILKDLTLASDGENASGESLLINFDRVFEDFIKKILMEYSSLGKFSYWTSPRTYAFCQYGDESFQRSYIPDLLFDCHDKDGSINARAILDMKNKTHQPFGNEDVYQMAFYGQMLSCKKIILCYPSSEHRESVALRFHDEQFFLQKLYAAFMNIAGNSAKEFKTNINKFIFNIESLL